MRRSTEGLNPTIAAKSDFGALSGGPDPAIAANTDFGALSGGPDPTIVAKTNFKRSPDGRAGRTGIRLPTFPANKRKARFPAQRPAEQASFLFRLTAPRDQPRYALPRGRCPAAT